MSNRPCSLGGCRDTGVPRRVPVEAGRHDATRATPTTLKPVLFHTAWFVRSNFFSSLICWARQINIFYDIIWKLFIDDTIFPKNPHDISKMWILSILQIDKLHKLEDSLVYQMLLLKQADAD